MGEPVSTDLVKVPADQSWGVAQRVAAAAMESGRYKDAKNLADLALIIHYGMEMGMGPASALRDIQVVQGKPQLTATAVAARIKSSGKYDYFVPEMSDEAVEVEVIHVASGRTIGKSRFTMADAQRAGVLKNPVYKSYPRNMLFARAIYNAARWFCPDVFAGALGDWGEADTGGVIAPVPDDVNVVTGEVIDLESAVRRANRDYDDDPITSDQRKRLFAIARQHGLSETALKDIVAGVTGEATTKSLTRRTYEEVVDRIESAEAHVAAMPRLDPDDDPVVEVHPDQETLV